MKIPGSLAAPDFEVTWRNGSENHREDVYCLPPKAANARPAKSRLRQAVATLQTETTYVEVSETNFASPITLTFTPHRPGFILLLSASSVASIDYGYEEGGRQSARLESVLFMLPGRDIAFRCSPGTFHTVTCSYELHYAERILGSFDDISASQLMRALDMKSSLTICILLRLMNEAIFPGPISMALIESLGNALLVECKHWMLSETTQKEGNGRLTAKHIEIIEAYLSNLTAKAPSVTEIADSVIDISRDCFDNSLVALFPNISKLHKSQKQRHIC